MIHSDVIIVGGGPAGSTCAWKLRQHGIECLILDKHVFPRTKLCAGWITPDVLNDLQIAAHEYPLSLVRLQELHVHLYRKELTIPAHQYAIRRYEFDLWLLKRSRVDVHTHKVKRIKKDGEYYVLDDRYRCRYLVGAGGTYCPVYRTFSKSMHPRAKKALVVTLEEEFPYASQDGSCHLWFFQNRLPGYAWYVPKGQGYINIGIGGFAEKLKARDTTITYHWQWFVQELERRSLVKNYHFNVKGYTYYIRDRRDIVQSERIFLIGDAAGLATRDLAEGIGPAVKSGLSAADSIITGTSFSLRAVKKYSLLDYHTFLKFLRSYVTKRHV